jgi:hypothetical protein
MFLIQTNFIVTIIKYILSFFISINTRLKEEDNFILNIKIMFPKLKVKVYFYHLFMLSIVMLLCFYLVYRDMKRIETNMLGIFNRITGIEKLNQSIVPKLNELIVKNELLENNNLQPTKENRVEEREEVEEIQTTDANEIPSNEDAKETEINEQMENIDNIMSNIVNLNESVLKEVSDDVKVEVSDDVKVEVSDDVKVEVSDDVKVDDVMDLVDSLETETTKDLSELSEEELNNKTNKELKEYLKLKGLSNAGNKTKLIETILKLK